ncbi:hypothetical protein WJ13_32185 [Burkholderia seminalis]|nr:hypothetical protein WJ13_32185 [Burkholderia seminalis]
MDIRTLNGATAATAANCREWIQTKGSNASIADLHVILEQICVDLGVRSRLEHVTGRGVFLVT